MRTPPGSLAGFDRTIAEQIVNSGADCVLALKGNQETLHQRVIDYIDEHSQNDFADVKVRRHITYDKGHRWEETRSYSRCRCRQFART